MLALSRSAPPPKLIDRSSGYPRAGRVRLMAVLSASSLAVVTNAGAQTPSPADAEAARSKLDARRIELKDAETKAKSIETTLGEIEVERERLKARLVDTAGLIQRSEARMTEIEGRLSELEAQEKVVRGSLAQRHGQIASLFGALQRMGRNPPPVLVTRREDALEMVRSAMLLSAAFPELKNQATELAGKLADLQRVKTEIYNEGQRLEAETSRLNEARTRLAGLMEAKKLTFADRQAELAAVKQATVDISKSVDDLTQLITAVDRAVSEKTQLGQYDRQLAAAEPAPSPTEPPLALGASPPSVGDTASPPAAGGPQIVAPPPSDAATADPAAKDKETDVALLTPLKPPIVELAPSGGALGAARPGRIQPAIPFATALAKLPLPAHGRRILNFGDRTQYGGQSKGMVLETRFSAQVTAPCDGWVLYAGEFRSYGQLLIIDAGGGYHVLLAGMSQIDVEPGQFVLTSEPVGTMIAGPADAAKQPAANAPVLYIEVRKDDRPINPDPWWATGQQKVEK